MRKLLHTTAALSALLATSMAANAADVRARPAPYAPPPPVYAPPPFSWSGFYVGGNIGGAWANRDVLDLLSSRSPAVDMPLLAVIRPGLIETGLVEGQNVAVCSENVVRFDRLIESLGGGVPRQGCSI
jgi:opacity protein-like surface antigen